MTREDAIKTLKELWRETNDPWYEEVYNMAIKALEAIPSSDRPSGEWLKFGLGRGTRILFCTNCERRIEVPLSQGDSNYDFCPNCGARMRGTRDEAN